MEGPRCPTEPRLGALRGAQVSSQFRFPCCHGATSPYVCNRSAGTRLCYLNRTHTRYRPEPHILLFRRLLGTNPTTGKVEQALKKEALSKYEKEYGSSAA